MASELRRWLTKQPRPALVVGVDANDREHRVNIDEQRGRWKDAEAVLSRCVTLEAFDEKGASLRVCDLDQADGKPTDKAPPNKEAETLQVFARLLKEAYVEGATANRDAYQLGFEQQREVLGLVQARLAALETMWHKLLVSQQNAADDGDPNASIVMALLAKASGVDPSMVAAAQAAAASSAAATPKSNGKAKA